MKLNESKKCSKKLPLYYLVQKLKIGRHKFNSDFRQANFMNSIRKRSSYNQ